MSTDYCDDNRLSYIRLILESGCGVYISKSLFSRLGWLAMLWRELGYRVSSYDGVLESARCENHETPSVYISRSRFSPSLHRPDVGVNQYVIVPGPRNPRWIIANDSGVIKKHGPIIKPSSTMSRVVWWIALALNRVGLFTAIFPYRISAFNATLGRRMFSLHGTQPSILYTGTLGMHQKFTIQYSDSDGRPKYFLKVAGKPSANARIENETFALGCMRSVMDADDSAFRMVDVPVVVKTIDMDGVFGFVQKSVLSNELLATGFVGQDAAFLLELYRRFPVARVSVQDYLRDITVDVRSEQLAAIIESIGADAGGLEMVLAASHGDYIPWNRFYDGERLRVIDWEGFGYRPVFYDLVHFCVFESADITQLSAHKTVLYIYDSIRMCISISGNLRSFFEEIDPKLYVKLGLIVVYVHVLSNGTHVESHISNLLLKMLGQLDK